MKENFVRKEGLGTIYMYSAVILWGGTYFFQKYLLDSAVPVFYMVGIRFSFVALLFFKYNPFKIPKSTWLRGSISGIFLALAFASQNFGLSTVDISVAAFITGLTVVFIPFLNFCIFRAKFQFLYIISIVLAAVGVYFFNLDASNSFDMNIGTLFCLLGSILFSLHVIATSHFLKKESVEQLNVIQLTVCAIIGYLFAFLTKEELPPKWTLELTMAITYLGVFGSVICYLLQTAGQKHIKSIVKIGLILALEPISATILAVVFGSEVLGAKKILGMVAIFVAVLISEFQEYLLHKKNDQEEYFELE